MPIAIHCPSCNRLLRVPEHVLGRAVQCPNCRTTFTAQTEEEEPPLARPARKPPDTVPMPPVLRPVEVPDDAPPWAVRTHAEPTEEDYQTEPRLHGPWRPGTKQEQNRQLRQRQAYSRELAESVVAGPALALQVTGTLGVIVGGLALTGAILFGFQGEYDWDLASGVSRIMLSLGCLCWGGIVLSAGRKMKHFEYFNSVRIGCFFALLPCNPAWLAGLPIAIWALNVLHKEDVRRVFDEESWSRGRD